MNLTCPSFYFKLRTRPRVHITQRLLSRNILSAVNGTGLKMYKEDTKADKDDVDEKEGLQKKPPVVASTFSRIYQYALTAVVYIGYIVLVRMSLVLFNRYSSLHDLSKHITPRGRQLALALNAFL